MIQLTEKEILDQFGKGIDCSQVVMSCAAKDIGIDETTAKKVSSCFGAGMMCGETCGAVTGALMAIGLKYGHYMENDKSQKDIMVSKSSEFKGKFLKKYSSFMCRDLLGYNIAVPEEMEEIIKKDLLTNFCPKVVENTLIILREVL
jgi:C_GCAxxG_C_C family probable redox protein